jgi:predicted pyridoxine 5'-phosphate oxidase superfamily flavin-nucleotide-binding protein
MSIYHRGNRAMQDQFDTRRLADRLEEVLVSETLSSSDVAFIQSLDHFFLATVTPDGVPTVGYKGGAPGFVQVVNERTLAFPNYNGNGMYMAMGNILESSMVGMLFINWQKGHRLRLQGSATINHDDELLSDYPEAQFVVRVHTTAIWPNCPRYIHRMEPMERSTFVPQEGRRTPVPSWKRSDWAIDVLPEGDPALDPEAPMGE